MIILYKYIVKMNKLVNTYEARIKNYVLKMAETPIVNKKNNNKNRNSCQSLLTFSPDNNLIKKHFGYKTYIPDKERVEEIILNKTILDKYLEKIGKINIKRELKNKNRNEPKLIQPFMRYTARTDLERIYDVIKKNENYYIQKNAIKKHLKKIELKSHSMEDNNYDEYDMENEKTLNDNIKNSYNNMSCNMYKNLLKEKKNNLDKRLYLLNFLNNNNKSENKKFKNSNQKTEFKAMENLKMFKTSTLNLNKFNKIKNKNEEKQKNLNNNYDLLINEEIRKNYPVKLKIKMKRNINTKINLRKNPIFKKINSVDNLNTDNIIKNSIFNNTSINSFYKMKNNKINDNAIYIRNNSYVEQRQFNIYENKNALKEFNLTNEIVNSNPLLYNINHSNDKKRDLIMIWNKDNLKELKKIAFEKYENLKNSLNEKEKEKEKESSQNQYEDLKKEENIFIDGKEFKKTEIDKIAENLLKIYNKKN